MPEANSSLIPSVTPGSGKLQFRTEILTSKQLTDGKSLVKLLTEASAENWDLVEIVSVGERFVVVLRTVRQNGPDARQVGFTRREAGS
jgi:hypothetical protein